jgi:broad specificity phosphatase PhoE
MSRALWLVRHGERRGETSAEVAADGDADADRPHDPPLSERGRRQAELIGDRLHDCGVEIVYASPFLCAVETAHIVAERLGLAVVVDRGLSDGLTPDRFDVAPSVLAPRVLAERFATVDPTHNSVVRPNYPESAAEAADRTRQTVGRLLAEAPETALLVGHELTVASVVFGFTGRETADTPHGGITRLTSYPWGWDIDRLAETAHLDALESSS